MPEYTYALSQGDAGITIEAQLRDPDGSTPPVAGATVRWKMMNAQGVEVIDAVAAIDNPDLAIVQYTFTGPQLAAAGLFYGQWEVDFGAGVVQTYPNDRYATVNILPEVA